MIYSNAGSAQAQVILRNEEEPSQANRIHRLTRCWQGMVGIVYLRPGGCRIRVEILLSRILMS